MKDMKKSLILYSLALACSLFFIGCSEEALPESENGRIRQEGATQLTLIPAFNRNVTVKSVADANETVIGNTWVIQLDGNGNVLQGENAPLYEGNVINAGNNQYTIDIKLSSEAQEILFIANTGDNTLFNNVITKGDVEAKAFTFENESELALRTGMIMCGTWKTGDADYNIKMKRAIAKVDFTLEANSSFVLQSIQVKNVPNKLYYFRENLEADGNNIAYYPAISEITKESTYEEELENPQNLSAIWYDLEWMPDGDDLTGVLLNEAKTFTWYLPENGRGIGSATNQRDKNKTTAAEGQGDYCTYIQVKGFYRNEDLTTGVTYNIYLGENNNNNNNIIRNTNYKVHTTILGIDRTDTRISKEDGEEIPRKRLHFGRLSRAVRRDEEDGRAAIGSVHAPRRWRKDKGRRPRREQDRAHKGDNPLHDKAGEGGSRDNQRLAQAPHSGGFRHYRAGDKPAAQTVRPGKDADEAAQKRQAQTSVRVNKRQ